MTLLRTKIVFKVLAQWLPIAVASLVLCALIDLAVQQNYRQSANDPQIQIARDTGTQLETEHSPAEVVPANVIRPDVSLSPFTMVFDGSGHLLASSGKIPGDVVPPAGIFDNVRKAGEERFTWQPTSNIRLATVVIRVGDKTPKYFVVVARSLIEVEEREHALAIDCLAGLAGTLLASLAAVYAVWWLPELAS